jgi:hypothetical protein
MSLHAILVLVPDRTEIELVFLNPKSGFSLGELDIGVCTENLIRVDDVMESPKLAE